MNKTKNGAVAGALRTAASLVEESWDDPETIRIIAEANRIVKNILHVDAEKDGQGATSTTICGTEHQEGELQMQEFQHRVAEEKAELDKKIARLQTFTASELYQSLPNAEQARMSRQLSLMIQYSEVLGERIAAFV